MKQERKRKIEIRIIIATFLILLFTTLFEIYYAKTGFTNRLFPSNIIFFSLLNINIILTLLLLFMIFRNIVKAIFSRKEGSKVKLSTKLVISFFLFTTIPLLFQLFVSSIIIKSSVNRWFNAKIETSLNSTLYIYKKYIEEKKKLAEFFAEKFFYNKNPSKIKADGFIYGRFIKSNPEITLTILPRKPLLENRDIIVSYVLQSKKDKGANILPIYKRDIIYGYKKDKKKFAIVLYYIGLKLHKNLSKIKKNYEEYQTLKLMKNPIEKTYLISLLLVTLVIIFSATWFAFYIAKDITQPIYKLAKATEEISKGNLDMKIDLKSKDEVGILINSFNRMVDDLKKTRQDLLERQKFIEGIVNNINSGVISVNKDGKVTTINPFAKKLLNISEKIVGKSYSEIKNSFFEEVISKLIEKDSQFLTTYNLKVNDENLTLNVFYSPLKNEKNEIIGFLFVFNDLTQEILAQKAAAWKEVARRIAHEIKNPLTPIQISAQRLKRKYISQISENKEDFEKIINNIVNHVVSIKNMVNEFSKFAKMPDVKLKKENIVEVIEEIVLMHKNTYKDIDFQFEYMEIPEISLDRNLFSQAILNIIKNSIHALNEVSREKKIIKIEVNFLKDLNIVQIIISDNGPGIPQEIKDRIFEPYFSTKKRGTGIGLTIVKKIISDHNGYIRIQDNSPQGTKVIIELPVG